MFSIHFLSLYPETDHEISVIFADKIVSDLEACQLALAIHQTSNIPHDVEVRDDNGDLVVKLTKVN